MPETFATQGYGIFNAIIKGIPAHIVGVPIHLQDTAKRIDKNTKGECINTNHQLPVALSNLLISSEGGLPNRRLYSRLNWEGLS